MDLFFFILSVLLLLLGVVLLLASIKAPGRPVPEPQPSSEPYRRIYSDPDPPRRQAASAKASLVAAGCLLVLVGGVILFLNCFTTIGPRGVGVQTAVGKIQGDELGPGWHWVDPWNSVTEFDASVQTLKFYTGEKADDGDCITVRLANNTTACVDVTAQWNINHTGDVNGLFLQYKDFTNIHDNLVKRQLGSAMNEVFGGYDPLAVVAASTTANPSPSQAINTKDLQVKVRDALQEDLRDQISVVSVTIPVIHFDADTEARLKSYQAAKADTRIAEQQRATAAQQALAAKELAGQNRSLNDPGVRYQNCLNLIAKLAGQNQLGNLPATFNCATSGAAPNVLLQGK
jgi:regulator of protease activity HflC (stomatin/prohibitin superfamily)